MHRTLRESRHGLMTEDRKDELTDDLPEIARHTSERERRADDAERELVQWKKVRFMADKVGDEFDGYITGVTAFGLFIELIEHFVGGCPRSPTMRTTTTEFVGVAPFAGREHWPWFGSAIGARQVIRWLERRKRLGLRRSWTVSRIEIIAARAKPH